VRAIAPLSGQPRQLPVCRASAFSWLAEPKPAHAGEGWSRCPGSNWRPRPYQGRALPTELHRPSRSPQHSTACHANSPQQSLACQPKLAREGWSGRRGSNPRPTAWKAVTLPLSYSRQFRVRPSRTRLPNRNSRSRRRSRCPPSRFALRRTTFASSLARSPQVASPTEARSTPHGRRLVAREGLEPSKPLGRQIYSLLRLTASLPRQLSVLECVRPGRTFWSYRRGRVIPDSIPNLWSRWSWRRDLNPRPADYKSAALPD
jgi:hypothetical protein